jgi:hypothetical protein
MLFMVLVWIREVRKAADELGSGVVGVMMAATTAFSEQGRGSTWYNK